MRHANAVDDAFGPTAPVRLSPFAQATLVVGTLDLASCSLFWAFRDVPIWRVAQGAASLLLGPSAYALGMSSVMFGLVVLYTMAAVSVVGYHRIGLLEERVDRLPFTRVGVATEVTVPLCRGSMRPQIV